MPSKKATKPQSITQTLLKKLLPPRDPRGHKNTFGHLLLIGGSPGKVGALTLSARAALRTGVGLLTAATSPESFIVLQSKLPDEAMSAELPHLPPPTHFSALAIGPGWGVSSAQKQVFETLLQDPDFARLPWLLDADALNLVAQAGWQARITARPAPTVMTPHPAELARLLGCTVDQVIDAPQASAQKASHLMHAVIVLKGPETLIVAPDSAGVWSLQAPNDGMAKAGSGDVLTGILGGFLATTKAQSQDSAAHMAVLAVGLHSLTGQEAARTYGRRAMTSGDLPTALVSVLKRLSR